MALLFLPCIFDGRDNLQNCLFPGRIWTQMSRWFLRSVQLHNSVSISVGTKWCWISKGGTFLLPAILLLYSDPSVERFSHTCTWQFWGLFPRSNYISINSDADLMLTAHAPLHFWSTFYDGSRQICAFICNLLFTDDSC